MIGSQIGPSDTTGTDAPGIYPDIRPYYPSVDTSGGGGYVDWLAIYVD